MINRTKNKNTMKKSIIAIFAITIAMGFMACGNFAKPNPENRTYETAYSSSSTTTAQVEDDPYLENRLVTGDIPYENVELLGSESTIEVSTSANSECDVVVIVKHHGQIVRNTYIAAGGSCTFHVPNGSYQVFFYGGKGWNPNKEMSDGCVGGFVANESFSKDSEVSLDYQGVEYELIPQQNGNFSTQQSNANEIF